ncbi:hypothetical protein [Hafnia paralvei]|uniref:hypothetical protein n=1 Tax=Hafnia paralvei TaxID=546367 RepID=UPI001033DA26|nr:hypothetical protein [Hafnia paralvei]TBL61136.1 hypothetical protein EYY97_11770 [Hafnia paralvei]
MPGRRASIALGGAVPELSAEHGACHLSGRRAGLGVAGPDKPDEAGHHTAVMAVVSLLFCLPSPA